MESIVYFNEKGALYVRPSVQHSTSFTESSFLLGRKTFRIRNYFSNFFWLRLGRKNCNNVIELNPRCGEVSEAKARCFPFFSRAFTSEIIATISTCKQVRTVATEALAKQTPEELILSF